MLSKRAKNAIIFGFLGGGVGFVIALAIFTLSCALEFKAGWGGVLTISPATAISLSFIIVSLGLIIFVSSRAKSKIKVVGLLFAVAFFLAVNLISLKGNINYYPPHPDSNKLLSIIGIGAIVSLLVLILFIILGIKRGLDVAKKAK